MSVRLAALAIACALAVPVPLLACSCAVPRRVRPGEPPPTLPREPQRVSLGRQRVFVGHVLEVDENVLGHVRAVVRIVPEASWRGPMPEMVTLSVGSDAPCSYYFAGGRYLFIADVDHGQPEALVTAPCDYSWGLSPDLRMLAELGPPGWTAPPVGSRAMDARAIHLGEPLPHPTADTLTFVIPRQEGIVRFEIGDWSGVATPSHLPIFRLPPGLYQFRVTWTDGATYTSYVSLRCEERTSAEPCQVFRYFGGLRWPFAP